MVDETHLKKPNRIISKVKSKYWSRTHKYGIKIPKTIDEAKQIDTENGDTLWMDAVRMEMKNVMIAFEEYDLSTSSLLVDSSTHPPSRSPIMGGCRTHKVQAKVWHLRLDQTHEFGLRGGD